VTSVRHAAESARKQLERRSRPAGEFDAKRYFRGATDLGFYNVGTTAVRGLAHEIARENRATWTIDHACSFADILIQDRYLEVKSLGIEVLARFRRSFTPALLRIWKGWLAGNHSANWATTDAICGLLIGPLVLANPSLVYRMPVWARDKNMWVRRAAAVGLIPSVRKGIGLAVAYQVARTLQDDREDLIHKAVGWMLREAGKADLTRLEKYLRANGPRIPRTTVRYAIERFDEKKRRDLLRATLSARKRSHPVKAGNEPRRRGETLRTRPEQ
jgi:3-methyladenine DNA glycosylase AlkD